MDKNPITIIKLQKKNKLLIFICYLLLLISCNQTNESTTKTVKDNIAKDTTKQQDTVFQLTGKYHVPKSLQYCDIEDVLKDLFYPIGWSADGKIAYFLEPADEACGCYRVSLIVQDMITDKILWQWDFNDNGENKDNLTSIWWKNQAMFSEKLLSYKIIQFDEKIILSPLQINNRKYTLKIDKELKKDADFGFNTINKAVIEVTTDLGTKTIFKYHEDEYPTILNIGISGYLLNRFENRIAVIYYEEHRGYEGPPNVIRFVLTGCHLVEGYKLTK